MKLLFSLLMLGFTSFSYGQTTIQGSVKDSNDSEPVTFATIALYQNGILKTGAETDIEGYFRITSIDSGIYDIEIISTGYEASKIVNCQIKEGVITNLSVNLEQGMRCFEPYTFVYCYPLIYQDDTTQGHVFNRDEIRHSPSRN
ncbi:MAG: hypothetical protein GC192_09535 [Bacteroidetes bacterium]|nr:hypothetical protein [Bacteroidota bacterium]